MRLRAILLLGFFVAATFAREEPRALSVAELQHALTAQVRQKKFESAQWGIKVVSLASGAVLFETNAQKLLKPASNAKILTGALALDVLGAEMKIRTSLFAKGRPDANGRLNSELLVYGRGDPTFSARFQDG